MKIYIAGKVTGEEIGKVFLKFSIAEFVFKNRKHEVVNPMRITSQSWTWEQCMKACIDQLLTCDVIYMLNDWQTSKGATLEHQIAKIYNKKIIYQK
jgi:hypothetical protein